MNLKKKNVAAEQDIVVGWSYSKEAQITAEYTKFSPFNIGASSGIIVENNVKLKREISDEKYLPVKQSIIEIYVPDFHDKEPETVNVQAIKLMATRGEQTENCSFSKENWNYNREEKKITITINNDENVKASGEDEFNITYRYNEYVEDEKVFMPNNIKATIEEYSSNSNIVTTKEIHDVNEIESVPNDLVTYKVATNENSINKGKINANYNSEEAKYETKYTSTINVNIMTSDLIEQLQLMNTKDVYVTSDGTEVDASEDVYYKKLEFNYNEIAQMIHDGATIEIRNLNDEVIAYLNEENIEQENSCKMNFETMPHGIKILLNNVNTNENITIKVTRAIGKSSYEKAIFNTFDKIKNYTNANIKYYGDEKFYDMSESVNEKKIENSKTEANLKIKNEILTTTGKNDDVDIRILLNNNKKTSDLYVNPSFELVFPSQITGAVIKNVNLVNGNGLEIADYKTDNSGENVKLIVNLSGTQTEFVESDITNGTNIVLKVSLELDKYITKAQSYVKMYYCNEAATNYVTESDWKMSKSMPEGLVKNTNGFTKASVKYQGQQGLVVINSIANYDGQGSEVSLIGGNEKTAEIAVNAEGRIATMKLVALNNTGNKCTDIALVGRIPFEGNKSVVTGNDMGTNINTLLASFINEDSENPNKATIYYSTNEQADKNLNDESNGWTTDVSDLSIFKSFMICVEGEVESGSILNYSYDFQIPENIDYDKSLFGSFCGFYNNHKPSVISYETSEAAKVGLKTKSGLPFSIELLANIKDDEKIGENKYLTYKLNVKNTSDEIFSNIKVTNPIPNGTKAYVLENDEKYYGGDNAGYSKTESLEWNIESLNPGDMVTYTYQLKVSNGMAGKNVENVATVQVGDINQQSNTVYTPVEDKYFGIDFSGDVSDVAGIGDELVYTAAISNLKDYEFSNTKITFVYPEEAEFKSLTFEDGTEIPSSDLKINNEEHTVTYVIGQLPTNIINKFKLTLEAASVSDGKTSTYVKITSNDLTEQSSKILTRFVGAQLEFELSTNVEGETVTAGDYIEYIIKMKNVGEKRAEDITITAPASNLLDNPLENLGESKEARLTAPVINDEVNMYISSIEAGSEEIFVLNGYAKNPESSNLLSEQFTLSVSGTEIGKTDEVKFKVLSNSKLGEDPNEEKIVTVEENTHSISGKAWIDEQLDGAKSEEESGFSQATVNLLKNGKKIKTATIDSNGNYMFNDVENGSYDVSFDYDHVDYTITEKSAVQETEDGNAIATGISVNDSDVENVDLGVSVKDKFDLSVTDSLEKSVVSIRGKEHEEVYNDSNLAKIEVDPLDINKTSIKFVYKIKVENTGNVAGKATSIKDYLPTGTKLVEGENDDWIVGNDGCVYNDSLRGTIIEPGETKELTISLYKEFNGQNIGVLSNKVQLAQSETDNNLEQIIDGDFNTQETIVSISQGFASRSVRIATTVSIIAIIAVFAFMIRDGKIEIRIGDFRIGKKIYK